MHDVRDQHSATDPAAGLRTLLQTQPPSCQWRPPYGPAVCLNANHACRHNNKRKDSLTRPRYGVADTASGSLLDVSADRLSAWAHSRKLYAVAAFAHIVQAALSPQHAGAEQHDAPPQQHKPAAAKVT